MRRLSAVALVLATSLVSWRCTGVACGCTDAPPDFGLPYAIADQPRPALVRSDVLLVAVSYVGGCAGHRFEARRAGGDARRQHYALHHRTDRPETCRAMRTDTLRLTLPGRDASRAGLLLRRPSGADIVVVP